MVIGAGSFGTAVAVLLARGGFRTTLQTRTPEQCVRLEVAQDPQPYEAEPASRLQHRAIGLPSKSIPII